jgi:2-(1,2-epoxy-1,2-dihydrophenyl)acetyl-CoA isomerase
MTSFETLVLERHNDVAILSFNRPERLNAIGSTMLRDLAQAIPEVNDDEEIRIVILTGRGRGFCAGADLGERADDYILEEAYLPKLQAIHEAPKPWISAINGAAAGVGSAFAMCCDLTVMAEDAYLYQAFAGVGLIPDGGATWHLARTLGRKRAYEVIASGERISAQKCLRWGLCNRVVPSERLIEDALAWATELAGRAPLALRYAKQALNIAMEEAMTETVMAEAALQRICAATEDAREGRTAFAEKRKPVWTGR